MNRRSTCNVFSFPCWSLACMDTLPWRYSCNILLYSCRGTCKCEKAQFSEFSGSINATKWICIHACQSIIWGCCEHNAKIHESIIPRFREHNPPEPRCEGFSCSLEDRILIRVYTFHFNISSWWYASINWSIYRHFRLLSLRRVFPNANVIIMSIVALLFSYPFLPKGNSRQWSEKHKQK